MNSPTIGAIVWHDLTVPNAVQVRDFYKAVVGWTATDVDMGDYNDFGMDSAEGNTEAGVCNARGSNQAVPPQWIIYVSIADMDASLAQCTALGGKIIDGPRSMGDGRFCIIQDPAGAVMGLIQQ